MPKFVPKPIIIEAEQYNGPAFIEINQAEPPLPPGVTWEYQDGTRSPTIVGQHANTIISPGQWVIRWKPEPRVMGAATFDLIYDPMPAGDAE